jgi:hypothetical protein
MPKQIKIVVGDIEAKASLNDTVTAGKVWDILPFTSRAMLWGDEIYFDIPMKIDLEKDAKATVNLGDLAYWPDGPAMCIFLGKTPVSRGNEIRAASAVNVFGKINDVKALLGKVKSGEKITIRK